MKHVNKSIQVKKQNKTKHRASWALMSQRRVPIHIEDQTLATSVVRVAVMVVHRCCSYLSCVSGHMTTACLRKDYFGAQFDGTICGVGNSGHQCLGEAGSSACRHSSSFLVFVQFRTHNMEWCCTWSRGFFHLSQPNLSHSSRAFPKTCSLGESRSCQIDSHYFL